MTHVFKHSKNTIAIGFLLVLLLLFVILGIGLSRMARINDHMVVHVSHHYMKTQLVAAMRHFARERTIALHRMALMTDPFDRDDEYLAFRQAAWDFIAARKALLNIPMTQKEHETIEQSVELTRNATEIQEAVYILITENKLAEANALLLTEALQAQNRVLAHFSQFLEYQHDATDHAVDSAKEDYQRAVISMLVLGLIFIGLGTGIAILVMRRTQRIEQALFREKERAEVTLHSIVEAVITTDTQGVVEYLNPIAEQLTGWRNEEARGHPLSHVFHLVNETTRAAITNPIMQGELEGRVVSIDAHSVLIARDGTEYAVEESTSPIHDNLGRVIGYVLVFHDVTHSRHLARQLTWQATHDALTGLGNRLEFETVIARMWDSAKEQGKHHSLLYLDLDQFKVVNDTCGHAAGDELLRQIAAMISSKVREGDSVFRLGGDEFALLLAGCAVKRAEVVANDIRRMIEEYRFMWQGKTFAIGVSIGLVPIRADSTSVSDVMGAADSACFMAKEKGRNRVQVYEPTDSDLASRHGEMQWLPRIRAALEQDRFVLYHQKIVSIGKTGQERKTHYEILLRMRDESGNIVAPYAFMPAAERYGLMTQIDRWVIQRTIDWMQQHAAGLDDVELIFINLSGQSLNDERFLSFLMKQIERAGPLHRKLGFEVTETVAIANLSNAMRFITRVSDLGCPFALDDFGSGMSSFAYLKHLPVNKIKIDGVFVRDMLSDPVDMAMVEAINRIGHVMGKQTVAEFVENDAIFATLDEIGVDFAQGYGIHKPEPLIKTTKAIAQIA